MNTPHVPMDNVHLKKYAINAAKELKLEGTVPCRVLAKSLKASLRQVRHAQEGLNLWSSRESVLPGGVEWLLDNHYLAVREGERAREAFQRGKRLRRTADGDTLLQRCAQSALWATPDLDQKRLAVYLESFQTVYPLTERELSLFVPALAMALVKRLAALCGDLDALKADKTPPETMGAIFTALRVLSGTEWTALLEGASQVEQILKKDPSGHYSCMDEDTRRRYRQKVCQLAKKCRIEEGQTARQALELAQKGAGPCRHVGWYLYREPLGKEEHFRSGVSYVVAVLGLSMLAALALWRAVGTPLAAVLLLLPLSDIAKNVLDFLLVRFVPPRPVPKMKLEGGIPREGRTLCVVVSLLTGVDSGPKLATTLERYRLANRDAGPELRLGILADLPDGGTPMGEEGAVWMDSARRAIDALNEKYGGGFYLFFRTPVFSKQDERYMGWERKRGALTELVRLLKGKHTGLEVKSGEKSWLRQVKYVITLDSDTNLNVGTARELTGAMLHPLNQPVIDAQKKIVIAGHALFQPRVAVELEAANKSFFSKIFGGLGGVDPYGSTASDVYHDLFDQGTYTGKGVFSVDAFYTCLDSRFPDNAILSHDLLEGSYLRAGLLGEVELTDGCPWQVYSYYARLHRWIRGDWQLLPWLRRRVADGRGGWEINPLSALSRWKIFDNLRRSLSPIFTLLTLMLGMCFSGRVFAWAGGVAVVAAASHLLLSGAELAVRRDGKRQRYHSTVIAGLAGAILQTAVQLIFLPYQAYISLTAISAALWRMTVSHKNLLAWVTAAQTERGKGSVLFYYKKAWFSAAIGILVIFMAQLRFGKAVGLIWLLAPVLAWAVSRPSQKGKALPPADRAFLLHQATLIWRYFDKFLREEDHYLPPDNWQEQPGPVLARRTSPTNIGMGLLSVMSAADLDLTPRKRAVELIAHMLDTVEELEKWRGHLYNWYDTSTAQPLHPRYVSTVDSGNLRGCLIALREGLYQWGETTLAQRAEALSNAMDCAPLFEKERRLFSIGYEVERDQLTNGFYDLMASEARQTSFISVARGEVPARHWRRLGRMLLGDNDYCGMASWTGTMFEYFMPNLLLPCEPNSFLYETLAFCVYAQKRRGDKTKRPWGISESGFYAFDPGMSYQYKAHGVQALGLKRGLDAELVVSPYSSFLALLLAPRSALRNLRRLRDMGLEGRYGLYEAVDYTPARLAGNESYEVVRSYMSHHLGMSLVAINNVLRDNVMQKRFMKDCDMSAYRELLQERVPVGAPIMKQEERDFPTKFRPATGPALVRQGESFGQKFPRCHLLTNGNYSLLACDNGLNLSQVGETTVTLARMGEYYAPAGVSAFLNGPGGMIGLTPAPLYQKGKYSWEFDASGAYWKREEDNLSVRSVLTVPRRENGQLHRVEIRWRGKKRLEGELLFYLEPVLCPQRDFDAHPAFSRLFLECFQEGNGAVFHRRPRGEEEGPYLAVTWRGEGASASLDRAVALGRGGLRALSSRKSRPLTDEVGADPCLMVRIPISLGAGEQKTVSLALALGDTPLAAQAGSRRMLDGKDGGPASLAPVAQKLMLSESEALAAFDLLAQLCRAEERVERPPQNTLWPYGISGDLPIAAGRLSEVDGVEAAALWCRWHQLLSRAGYHFDLVLLLEEGGDYRRPLRSALGEELKKLGAESAIGAKGGIHLADASATSAVLAWSKAVLPMEGDALANSSKPEIIAPPHPVRLSTEPAPWKMEGDTVTIHCGEKLPPVGWSQVLCNPEFGWLTDETGVGLLWAGGNAREGKLTPWINDPLAVGGQEKIMVNLNGKEISTFAVGDGLPCVVTYGLGFVRWEKELDRGAKTDGCPTTRLILEGFVPQNENRRILRLTLIGTSGRVVYQLGEDEPISAALPNGKPVSLVTKEKAGRPCSRFFREDFRVEQEQTLTWWREIVSPLTVETPDGALNRYLGGWCLYQVAACRIMARTSQYQNGGAFGFRDQLQDAAALVYTWPQRTREQLLLAASRQFEEGDVQHWWHPPQGAGVRTRISDDLLWLPWVLCQYCTVTGDWSILGEEVPYLAAKPLKAGEKDRYEVPQESERVDSLYRHGLAAILCALDRGVGPHGLANMGSGDWNDGMDRVEGESVWLTWFLAAVLQDFAVLCRRMDENSRADDLLRQADSLIRAAQNAWDGGWYRRGYYEDGTPLGSRESGQCQIDSIAQSFSVFPGGTDRKRANEAVSAALDRLFDREHNVVRLFDPAFDSQGDKDPGYIKGYPAGVRENGGQYTHASVWLAMACFRLDRPTDGWAILKALLPEGHKTEIYRAEPYVIAADVSYASGRIGRAGWSWYTGAAGWYWQVAVQELLGLNVMEGRLTVEPNLPPDWPGYRAKWKLSGGTLEISVQRTGSYATKLDGKLRKEGVLLAQLTGTHRLEVTI